MVIRSRIRIPDHVYTSLIGTEYGILGDLLAFLIQSPAAFHVTRRNTYIHLMTDADNVMNPQHFGSDPADIRIQIRLNPEIWIQNWITSDWG